MVYHAAQVYRRTATLAIRGNLEAKQASLAAEQANRSKTQFFVAASHDLRQPLHAMGLYAEALMDRVHDSEATRLVRGINSSVDALDELFSELLDVSRLDTGVVTAHARDFALAPLFRKLSLCYEPVAHHKGLSLRLRAGDLTVHADPVLVERILRNLVANALRCTLRGGVLVSARQQGGAVLLQVWDTGIGISAPERQRVFDAFYQVPTEAVPEHRRGLGLGLSIVQRFADLMKAPLGLRSQPGRGTVFSLTLQTARKAVRPPAPTSPLPVLGLGGLSRQPVWLVEDDVAVRTTVAAWLTDWGADVSSFDVTAAQALLTDKPSSSPALLIVGTESTDQSGAEPVARFIELVRRHCGRALPAIIIGAEPAARPVHHDTLSQWLGRPVLPHKLRALVGAQLARGM
ncbi:MAG: HAMP domain-containing sensor histidine kinase [Pseudomonadota bacterium]